MIIVNKFVRPLMQYFPFCLVFGAYLLFSLLPLNPTLLFRIYRSNFTKLSGKQLETLETTSSSFGQVIGMSK